MAFRVVLFSTLPFRTCTSDFWNGNLFPFRFGFPPPNASMSRDLPLCTTVLLPAPLLLWPWVYTFTLLSPDSLVRFLEGGKPCSTCHAYRWKNRPCPFKVCDSPNSLYFLPLSLLHSDIYIYISVQETLMSTTCRCWNSNCHQALTPDGSIGNLL